MLIKAFAVACINGIISIFTMLVDMDRLLNENQSNSVYQSSYTLELSGENALMNGSIPAEALNELSIAILGREATVLMDGNYSTSVIVSSDVTDKDDIETISLQMASGEYINASKIIQLEEVQVLSSIPRIEGEYAMVVSADYDLEFDKNETLQSLKAQIEEIIPDDVTILYDGEAVTIKENFGRVGILGLVALAVVFVILLLLQFQSFRIPLIIFITIQLSVIGSVTGLYGGSVDVRVVSFHIADACRAACNCQF